ncbi:fused MFS/spermidine synthase [Bradyrhizobium jicamae]|uniref:Fused MFS/spermidine synthase n=1 Tax=Bradyrhizobium jicamae TaxID=280332 RepID=A0ABS5FEZ4_9BRAD|nr:fused MFS/spermidine synthase [Bradyrhizobium jicamae]MBR0795374.1 fused MFS/spermidine synthase [Bradyrhizobium jicamae]MBR0932796.1 fused MFS/spermidine synthase [Bradyrhizobium jicamae]
MTALEMSATGSASLALRHRILPVLFFFSGVPALIYQLTWQRSLFRIFGVNTESVTIVVTAFMLGLGLGSLAGGWITRRGAVRPLLLLGVIEMLTAIFGLASLAIFEQVGDLALDWPLPAIAAVNLLLVLIPTLLMGATLPILVSHLVRTSGQVARSVGLLYYVNTLGASAACLLSAFVIFPYFGMQAAVRIAAAINIAVALGAFMAWYRRLEADETRVSPARVRTAQPILSIPLVMLLAAIGGFVSLSSEIFLFRVASFASGSSSMAFAVVLCGFLAGIAGGAYNASRLCATLSPADAIHEAAKGLIWANVFGAAFLPLVTQGAGTGFGLILIMLAGIYLIGRQWGALLPFLSHFGVAADGRAGMQTALLYSANIAGCATGAVLTGFVLANHLDSQQMSMLLLAIGTMCSLILIYRSSTVAGARGKAVAIAVAVFGAGTVIAPPLSRNLFENLQAHARSDHPFARVVENRSGVITVDTDGTVFGNGMYDGRFNTSLKSDRNGIIRPFALSLFHPAPREVLMIGLATGSWAQVIANNPFVERLTIVEINPGYTRLIAEQPEVQSVLHNPKVTIIEDDGRRWLNRHPGRTFDAVVSNTTWNFRANTTNLLSTEFLQLVGRHLNPGGIMFYNATFSRRVEKTGCTAFPYGARFTNHVVASNAPIDWNYERWRKVLESYTIDGKPEFNLTDRADREFLDALMQEYRLDGSMIEQCPTLLSRTTDKALVTDDNMGTEWRYYLNLE